MINLLVDATTDDTTRENMKRLQKELSESQVMLRGNWKFFDITVDEAVTNYRVKHGFNFIPMDVIETFCTEGENVLWNYSEFDRTEVDLTTTGALRVRALIGLLKEGAGEL